MCQKNYSVVTSYFPVSETRVITTKLLFEKKHQKNHKDLKKTKRSLSIPKTVGILLVNLRTELVWRGHYVKNNSSQSKFRNRPPEDMQQIYLCRRTPIPKCDFNKVAKQPCWNHTSAWLFSCKFADIFRTLFYKITSGGLLLLIDPCRYIRKPFFSSLLPCSCELINRYPCLHPFQSVNR